MKFANDEGITLDTYDGGDPEFNFPNYKVVESIPDKFTQISDNFFFRKRENNRRINLWESMMEYLLNGLLNYLIKIGRAKVKRSKDNGISYIKDKQTFIWRPWIFVSSMWDSYFIEWIPTLDLDSINILHDILNSPKVIIETNNTDDENEEESEEEEDEEDEEEEKEEEEDEEKGSEEEI